MKKLGFGMMRLPVESPSEQGRVRLDEVCRMVDFFLERGFTYFDTAYMYHEHESERVIRKVLTGRYERERFVLADKLPVMILKGRSAADQERIFEEQLEKCGVDYFDRYLLHGLNSRSCEQVRELDSFGFLRRLKEEGRARHIGFSFHDTPALLDQLLTEHPEVEFVQLQINYLDWDSESVQSRLCYETAARHGKRVVVMEPVKGGRLAWLPAEAEKILRACRPQWSPAAWALRFAAGLEQVEVVLSGMSAMEQVEENTAVMDGLQPLTEEERAALAEALEIVRRADAVPCTACRYCVEGCPSKIAIPEYFALYNREQREGEASFADRQAAYRALTADHGRPADCVACGQCEAICPQHIPVIHWLQQAGRSFRWME